MEGEHMQKLEKIQQDGFKNEGYAIEKSIEESPGNKNEDSEDIDKRENEKKIMENLKILKNMTIRNLTRFIRVRSLIPSLSKT